MRIVSVFCVFFLLMMPFKARAIGAGESVLVVGISTVSGAVLGASTLPFYEDSSAHTKNIFYGAAIGAVVGVLISAYSGVEESKAADDEAAVSSSHGTHFTSTIHHERNTPLTMSSVAVHAPSTYALGSTELMRSRVAATAIWSPLVTLRF